MVQQLFIVSGTVELGRAEEFQVAFRTMVGERLPQLPFVKHYLLVHHGEDRWSVYVLIDGTLALSTKPTYDVPTPVQLFRDFGTEPSIELADVSAYLTPEVTRSDYGPRAANP